MGNLGGFCMVFVDLCENEIADMVESFYRNGDGSSRILTNRAVGEIVEHYCSFEADGRITTNLRDFLLYSVVLYDTIGEAVDDGVNLEEVFIIEDRNCYTGNGELVEGYWRQLLSGLSIISIGL